MGKFMPHAILQRKGKRGSVVKGRGRARATGIAEENWRNSGNTGSSEHRRRRVTFVLDYFSYQEKESNLSLTSVELEVGD
jgi:hypothetical protein